MQSQSTDLRWEICRINGGSHIQLIWLFGEKNLSVFVLLQNETLTPRFPDLTPLFSSRFHWRLSICLALACQSYWSQKSDVCLSCRSDLGMLAWVWQDIDFRWEIFCIPNGSTIKPTDCLVKSMFVLLQNDSATDFVNCVSNVLYTLKFVKSLLNSDSFIFYAKYI